MENSDRWLPDGVDVATLSKVLRSVPGHRSAKLISWTCRGIWEPRVTSTRGVYRITAELAEGEGHHQLQLVLKLLTRMSPEIIPGEAELYGSGALASLEGELRAPEHYGVTEGGDGAVGVWLEYLLDARGRSWSIEQFARTAFHLGQLAALRTGPVALATRLAPRRNLCLQHALVEENLAKLGALRSHPLVRRAYPPSVAAGFLALWEQRASILPALERVPYVVCHGDAQKRNLFAHVDSAGRERTIAIDWANLATAPLGADLATLVHYALVYFDVDGEQAAKLDEGAYDGYVRGLQAGGWRGDPRLVRLAYAAQLSLGLGLLEIDPVLRMAPDESRHGWAESFYGRPIDQILDRRAAVAEFLLRLGGEARILAER